MNFLMYPNDTSDQARAVARKIAGQLCAAGHDARALREADEPWLCAAHMAVVVGGDGTVLRAVRALHEYGFPFWAVNAGHLGYLTECEPGEAEAALARILAGAYRVEKRAMLAGCLHSGGEETRFLALNEAVIHRSGYARNMRMRLSVDGAEIQRIAGDGLLVSTPTGSTAYNLSAGGPILLPESVQAVITPICPHAALCPPLVVDGSDEISISVDLAGEDEAGELPQLVVDGCQRLRLHPGDRVVCHIADQRACFVKTGTQGFYRRLQSKMAQNR